MKRYQPVLPWLGAAAMIVGSGIVAFAQGPQVTPTWPAGGGPGAPASMYETGFAIMPPWMVWLLSTLGPIGGMCCIACVMLWRSRERERDRNDKLTQALLETAQASTKAMADLSGVVHAWINARRD